MDITDPQEEQRQYARYSNIMHGFSNQGTVFTKPSWQQFKSWQSAQKKYNKAMEKIYKSRS